MAELERDELGELIFFPVDGWEASDVLGARAILQLRHVLLPDHPPVRASVQLSLTVEQCRLLAADLIRVADLLEQPPPGQIPS